MGPWLDFGKVDAEHAEFIVRYLSDDQRHLHREETNPFVRETVPLHEVWLDGRRYARIHAGPAHRGNGSLSP